MGFGLRFRDVQVCFAFSIWNENWSKTRAVILDTHLKNRFWWLAALVLFKAGFGQL